MAIARQIDPVPAGVHPPPAQAPVRMGPVGRAMVLGWYLGLIAATAADASLTGHLEAVCALIFVVAGTMAILLAEELSLDRAILRCLLVGLIGLVAGVAACIGAGGASQAAAEFLSFGAMSMLMGALATLPLVLASMSSHR